jgi:hypothetical protein
VPPGIARTAALEPLHSNGDMLTRHGAADNIEVRAKSSTTFTDHAMQVPQILFFKVANELALAADLIFVRPD